MGLALARTPSMGDWEVDWVWTLWWTVVVGVGFMLLLLSRGECRLWFYSCYTFATLFRCVTSACHSASHRLPTRTPSALFCVVGTLRQKEQLGRGMVDSVHLRKQQIHHMTKRD